MEERYYQPSIEEFHIGFEYEINIAYKHSASDKENIENALWIKASITKDNWNCNMDRVNVLGTVRVKYLSKEDIESLFNEVETVEFEIDNNFEFTFWRSGIEYLGLYTDHMISFYSDKIECIFRGTIKNINELRKLKDQLGL